MSENLVEYLDKLRPQQKDYIIHCVNKYGPRDDIHHGLLPFLNRKEVILYLRAKLLINENNPDNPPPPQRFIYQLLSVLDANENDFLFDNEDTATMRLSTNKLHKRFRRLFNREFIFSLRMNTRTIRSDDFVKMKWKGSGWWDVTTHKRCLDQATTFLADIA